MGLALPVCQFHGCNARVVTVEGQEIFCWFSDTSPLYYSPRLSVCSYRFSCLWQVICHCASHESSKTSINCLYRLLGFGSSPSLAAVVRSSDRRAESERQTFVSARTPSLCLRLVNIAVTMLICYGTSIMILFFVDCRSFWCLVK